MKKSMTLPVAVAVAIIGCVLAVSASVTTSKMQQGLEQERYKRLRTEEALQKAQMTVKALEAEFIRSQKKIEGIEKILNQGRTNADQLMSQLQSVNQEKEKLQQQLQELQEKMNTQQNVVAPEPGI